MEDPALDKDKFNAIETALDKVIDVESINMDQNIETDIKKEACEANPWSVDDASVFLKYCCPECEYHEGDLKVFSNHALKNHERSYILFNDKNNGYKNGQIVPKTENDLSEIADHDDNDNDYDSEDPAWKLPDKKSLKLESVSPQQKRQKIFKCVVPFCQSLGSIGFYKFPQDPIKNEAWMKYCGMTRPSDQNDRVCHLHFDKSSFGNSVSPNQRKQLRLRPNAMPELHIPNVPVPDDYDQADPSYEPIEEEDYEMAEDEEQETKVDQHIIDHLKVDHDELKPLSTRRRRSKTKKKKYENHTTKCEICEVDFESRQELKLHNFEEHKNNKEHLCPYCDFDAKSKINKLKRHIELSHPEHGEKKFFCDDCDDTFFFEISYKTHRIQKHGAERPSPKCEICDMKFTSVALLKTHNTEKHESGGQKICLYCDYRTKDLKSIKYHIDTKHPEHGPKKHFCNLCDKGFMFEGSLKFHMAQHKHKEKLKTITHVCDLCGKELSSLKTLEQHKLLYHPTTDVTEYMCEFCAFSTPSSKKLQIHKLSQHEFEKHKQCPHCDFKSPFNQKIRRHIDRQHPEHGEKQFFCDQCGKGFIFHDSFKQHRGYECKSSNYKRPKMSQSTRAKIQKKKKAQQLQLQCDYCEEVMNTSFKIKLHYRTLHPNKPIFANGHAKFTCPECNDIFFKQEDLECHLNLEHGAKTDKNWCKKCKQSYRDQHTACANDYKSSYAKKTVKLQCPHCEKSFAGKLTLQSHIDSVHNNCSDFECEQCGKKFGSLHRLKGHIWQSHNQVTCELCNKALSNPTELRKHKVFVHNDTKGAWLCEKCPKTVFFLKTMFDKHIKDKH